MNNRQINFTFVKTIVFVNLPSFIANRLSGKDKENFSGPVVRIAVVAVALGLSVMLFSVSVLVGFQQEIREKVIGFSAHIQITHFDANESWETAPVTSNQPFYPHIIHTDGIRHIQAFAQKAGIIKTEDQMEGVILKGVGPDFDWNFMKKHLIAGEILSINDTAASDGLIISGIIARKLMLNVGDVARMYFISGAEARPRGRRLIVTGIYETGLEEFDQTNVIGDIRHVQRLNNWDQDQVSGFEIFVDRFQDLEKIGEMVYQQIGYDLNAETVVGKYPQIFDWLRLMDINVVVILVMMIMVAGITVISTLLILILEKTSMIGTLKALGMRNTELRKLFFYLSSRIIIKGMIWGNLIGLGIILLQYYIRFIPLDQESYYVSYVPVSLNIAHILLINTGTLIACLLIIIIPGYIIRRITPVKAIRFN